MANFRPAQKPSRRFYTSNNGFPCRLQVANMGDAEVLDLDAAGFDDRSPFRFAEQHRDLIASVFEEHNQDGCFLTFVGHGHFGSPPRYGICVPFGSHLADPVAALYEPALKSIQMQLHQTEGYTSPELQQAYSKVHEAVSPFSNERFTIADHLQCKMAGMTDDKARHALKTLFVALTSGWPAAIKVATTDPLYARGTGTSQASNASPA